MPDSSARQPESLRNFLHRHGIGDKPTHRRWFGQRQVLIDGAPTSPDDMPHVGSTLSIRGKTYSIASTREPGRLMLRQNESETPQKINGRVRVHCGYHKCMTIFFKRVSKKTGLWINPFTPGYRHFFHCVDEFYRDCTDHNLTSISGHCLDLDRFSDIRVVHIVRDPRDLILSGYHYHRRSAEPWCDYIDPTDEDWSIVNAPVPVDLPSGTSFSTYLNDISLEKGLAAEIEFRRHHLQSMQDWPTDDKRVMTVRYEDIMGDEAAVFRRIYEFYGLPMRARLAAAFFAGRYAEAGSKRKSAHIRNAAHGQWRAQFPESLAAQFRERYGDLLEKYGYDKT